MATAYIIFFVTVYIRDSAAENLTTASREENYKFFANLSSLDSNDGHTTSNSLNVATKTENATTSLKRLFLTSAKSSTNLAAVVIRRYNTVFYTLYFRATAVRSSTTDVISHANVIVPPTSKIFHT